MSDDLFFADFEFISCRRRIDSRPSNVVNSRLSASPSNFLETHP